MISCILKGGLGNQMFQIAAVIELSLNNRIPFCFDESTWPTMGGAGGEAFQASPPKNYLNNIFRKLPFKIIKSKNMFNIYNEPFFHYSEIQPRHNLLLNGYFQSDKYFIKNSKIIKKVFSPSKNIIEEFNSKYRLDNEHELVSIHVRRGSHLRNPKYHGSCDLKYFQNSMSEFSDNARFLVFSDDMKWCKENFNDERFVFVEGRKDYEDLYFMSLCDHNIICNSTFSWWSAWLNTNESKKVISPKKWFGPGYSHHDLSDLTPTGWTIIDNGLEGE